MSGERKTEKREPLFHIVKRTNLTMTRKAVIYAIAIVGSMIFSSLICAAFAGQSPIAFFAKLFKGAFGTERKIWVLLREMALLLGTSVALVPAFKMKFWNLGGNGQILVGCLSAVACMKFLGGKLPNALLVFVMLFASLAAGIVWALIPAVFKAFFNTNESLFTLMMNYIATGLVSVCIATWVKSGSGILSPIDYGNVPNVINPYFLTIAVFFLLAVVMYVYLKYSKHGYEISVVGESVNTAKYIGINVKKVILRTMLLSGAIAGLVGFFIAGAIQHTVSTGAANNMGFTAIMTSWLAAFNPLMMFLTCFFIVFVTQGMVQVRTDFRFTNDSITNFVIGLIYFCVIACAFFIEYRIVFRQKHVKEEKK